jgi:isoquinoline 1-oxidoreductase beta subunit
VGRGGRFRTYVAEAVELHRERDRLAVRRVFCAVDPGLAVNPNTLTAQIEGGIGFAMTRRSRARSRLRTAAQSRPTLRTIR